jgi:hypothetical protein
VAVPDVFACLDALVEKGQRIGLEPDSRVEQQRQVARGCLEPGPPRLEAALAAATQDPKRKAPIHAGTRHICTGVARAVVDEDELGVEAAAFERREQGVDGPGKMPRLVSNRNHDAQQRYGHRATVT